MKDTFINSLKGYYNCFFFLLQKSLTVYANQAGAQPIVEPCITFKQYFSYSVTMLDWVSNTDK